MSRVCIVVAGFYADLADELLRGAAKRLEDAGHEYDVVPVPGAFEIPAAIRIAMDSKRYEGYVALGCVIRGQTSHYDYVCTESARGLNQLAIDHRAAIGYGILTVENFEQAWERAAIDKGNKGAAAVEACLTITNLKIQMKP